MKSQNSQIENNFNKMATTTYNDWAQPKNMVVQKRTSDSRTNVNKTELGGQENLVNSTSFRGAGTAAGSSQANIQGGAQSVATLHQSEILSQLAKADSFFTKNRKKSKDVFIPKPFDHRQRQGGMPQNASMRDKLANNN